MSEYIDNHTVTIELDKGDLRVLRALFKKVYKDSAIPKKTKELLYRLELERKKLM